MTSLVRYSSVLLGLLLATSAYASKEVPTIGLSLDSFTDERWQRDRDTFVSAVEGKGGKVLTLAAQGDDAVQVANLQSLVAKKVDVIVVVPHSGVKAAPGVEAAAKAGIPVISYDRLVLDADVAYYLSFDNVKVGEAQASYVASRLPADRKAKIVRIYGAPTDNNAKLFKDGQDKVLKPLIDAGKVEVVFEGWAADWRADAAKKIMQDAIAKAGTGIDAVLAANDVTAGAAVEAITEAKGDPHKMLITGQDGDKAACVRITDGVQSMTVYKPVRKLAERAAAVAIDVAKGNPPHADATVDNGRKPVPAIYEEIVVVDKDNLSSTIIADRFRKR